MTVDAERLAVLAAWRATQGIYRFDPDLYAALVTTPVGRLPVEILTLLPEWGIYIETPGMEEYDGFFASCDYNPRLRRPVLVLILLMPDNLVPVSIPIIDGMLFDAIDVAAPGFGKKFAEWYQPLVSLVLYICSITADFSHYTPGHPAPTRTRRGPRIFPPDKPVIIPTGDDTGAILRISLASAGQESQCLPSGRHISPHIRRAHWHCYWIGQPRRAEIRWMPPILVNTDVAKERVRQVKRDDPGKRK